MLEVSRVGVAEGDDEIELSLELSIGGSYRKLEKLNQVENSGKESEKGVEHIVPRPDFSFPETIVGDQVDTESGSGSEVVDSQRKREIQALRRQEARRKREEKLRKSAANSKGINGVTFCVGLAKTNDKVWLEAQRVQTRARDREMRENDAFLEDLARKEEKIAQCVANENVKDSNFTFRNDRTGCEDHGPGSKPAVSFLQNVPVTQMQGPYPLQCVTLKNGFGYPHMVPCRGPNVGKEENETKGRNILQPVTSGGFRPYPNGNGNLKHDSGIGGDSEHNTGKSRSGIQKVFSNGSLERTSSAMSDHRSTSEKGGSSSETGSHSSSFGPNEQQFGVSAITDMMGQRESCGSSDKKELGQVPKRAEDKSEYSRAEVSGKLKPVSPTTKLKEPSTLRPTNEATGTIMPSLPQMPCVSTTGNGPNGKTITGFLYRYTKTEVSIVCVCHGSSFSPAEFVEHAGGTDITHPLRHITIVPSSFG